MTRPVIAVDCDGVLADLIGAICWHLNGRLDVMKCAIVPADFKHYSITANLPGHLHDVVDAFSRAPGSCKSLGWYPGAREFLETLRELGETYAVTAPWHAPTWDSERRDWLADAMPRSHVISVSALAKPWACAAADILIEDNVETIAAWLELSRNGIAILIDRPWNQNFTAPNCHRATSYAQAVEQIRKYL